MPARALIVEPYTPWGGVTAETLAPGDVVGDLRAAAPPTTQAVRLTWEAVQDAGGYVIYRSTYDPEPDRALGLPLGEMFGARRVSYEDRLDLDEQRYWYSVVVLDENGREREEYAVLAVEPVRAVSAEEAELRGWVDDASTLALGERLPLVDALLARGAWPGRAYRS